MNQIPTGSELARPFLPAKDFGISELFYGKPGFEKLLDGAVAIFKAGASRLSLARGDTHGLYASTTDLFLSFRTATTTSTTITTASAVINTARWRRAASETICTISGP
jgi:hypothetical protein